MSDKYQPKEGYGSFLSNTKSTEKQPDFKGSIMLDGKVWKLGIWRKSGTTNGRQWELLTAKVDSMDAGSKRPTKQEVDPFNDSDVPF